MMLGWQVGRFSLLVVVIAYMTNMALFLVLILAQPRLKEQVLPLVMAVEEDIIPPAVLEQCQQTLKSVNAARRANGDAFFSSCKGTKR